MRTNRSWLVASGASLVGFVLLTLAVTRTAAVDDVDQAVQQAVLALRSDRLTPVMQAATMLGSLPVVLGTSLSGVLVLAVRTRSWTPPIVLASAVALSAATIALVKVGVGRPRPGAEDRIGPAALDFAFPSGHTGNGSTAWCAVVALVCLTLPPSAARAAVLVSALVLSAGIGLSRVYLGYHWPTDVVGAWMLAAAVVCAAVHVTLSLRGRGTAVASFAVPDATGVARSSARTWREG